MQRAPTENTNPIASAPEGVNISLHSVKLLVQILSTEQTNYNINLNNMKDTIQKQSKKHYNGKQQPNRFVGKVTESKLQVWTGI